MPLANLFTFVILFVAVALLYRFRNEILAPFRRFEARNQAKRADEAKALFDRYAHYRQTIKVAEEQVEDVEKILLPDERTGQPVEHYLFQGVQYVSKAEAEAARYTEVIGKARDFYVDLDRAWLPRRGRRDPLAAALPDPAKGEKVTPPRP